MCSMGRVLQGEDVSVGIWLSPLTIDYVHDEEFSCVRAEDAAMGDYAAVPELSPEEMRARHRA